jgi:hypothetical protein
MRTRWTIRLALAAGCLLAMRGVATAVRWQTTYPIGSIGFGSGRLSARGAQP